MTWSELEDIIIDSKVRLHSVYILFGYNKESGFSDVIEHHEALGENGAVKDVAKVWENVTTLCNYMFDDGAIDVNNDLLEIRQMANELYHEAMKHEATKQLFFACHKVVQNIDKYFKRKGITVQPQHEAPEASQQASEGNDGELTGNGKESAPEGKKQPVINIEDLPTIFDDEVNKVREQQVLYNAIQRGWMELKGTTYNWLKNYDHLAFMCGLLYWGDKVIEDRGIKTDSVGEYPIILSKSSHRFNYKHEGITKTSKDIKELFGGVNVSNYRSQLNGLPKEYGSIMRLFPQIKTGL